MHLLSRPVKDTSAASATRFTITYIRWPMPFAVQHTYVHQVGAMTTGQCATSNVTVCTASEYAVTEVCLDA